MPPGIPTGPGGGPGNFVQSSVGQVPNFDHKCAPGYHWKANNIVGLAQLTGMPAGMFGQGSCVPDDATPQAATPPPAPPMAPTNTTPETPPESTPSMSALSAGGASSPGGAHEIYGPESLRQGIGTRRFPSLASSLAGLRKAY